MTTYSLKQQFQNVLRPTAARIDARGITANQVTAFTCFLSVLYGVTLAATSSAWLFFLFPVFFPFRMALNALDGMIAKERQQVTRLGGLLNELGDSISDFALAAGFFFTLKGANLHFLWGFISLSMVVDLAGLWSFSINGKRSFAGPMGKSDRGIPLSVLAIVVGVGLSHGEINQALCSAVLLISLLLMLLTVIHRCQDALKQS